MLFDFPCEGISFISMTRATSRKLGAALIVIGAALLIGTRGSSTSSNRFVAEAIIQVIKPSGGMSSSGETLRMEAILLESTAVLDGVISNLNLTAKWADPNGTDSTLPRLRHRLSNLIDVRENETAQQIRLRVAGPDKSQAEELANSVLRVYAAERRTHFRQMKPKNIVALEEQLEDIEPRLQLAIETMERIGKDLSVTDPYQAPRNEPTLLDRIRDGKDEDPGDSVNSLYGIDPAPKNETPEQAKRRIYNHSRRTADVLSLRKERIETRLEILRANSSTPESASVQVVQAPEAVSQSQVHAGGRGKSGWTWVGWGAMMAGLILIIRPPGNQTA